MALVADAEIAPGTHSVGAFSNVHAFETDDGLVLVDTGFEAMAGHIHETVRRWRPTDVRAAVFTHGHVDHVLGLAPFEEEARARGRNRPRVVAHELVPARFDRYRSTADWNTAVNRRQFGLGEEFHWPTEYRYPDETYRDRITLDVGGERFELRHGKGETDDATWVFVPDRRILCTGDFFIWASPNAGNPQKVQRFAREWALALEEMAACDAEVLLPGHGVPVIGADRVRRALTETAELLDGLQAQTVEMMNAGAQLDEIIHSVHAPPHLLERPYLRPVYDEPEFVVRNVWRFFGGWWDGNPAHLQPASEGSIARELAGLAGGATRLADRAAELAASGELRLAGHLAELAALAAPDDVEIHRVRAEVFARRTEAATSTMAKGVYRATAAASEAISHPPE